MGTSRQRYLSLGGILGTGHTDFVYIDLIRKDGQRRELRYTGGSGLAPGRIQPYIVPMMPGSTYSIRTALLSWRIRVDSSPIAADLARGAALQAGIAVPEWVRWSNVGCFGLQIFWIGRAVSNIVQAQ